MSVSNNIDVIVIKAFETNEVFSQDHSEGYNYSVRRLLMGLAAAAFTA